MHILRATLDSKLKFETHRLICAKLRQRQPEVWVLRSEHESYLLCPRVLKSYFVWFSLEYCAPVWMLSAESIFSFLDGVVCSAERCVRVSFVVWGTEGRSDLSQSGRPYE